MSTTKIQVFLSSRFGEFADYRDAIVEQIRARKLDEAFGLEVIDLRDGLARARPPQEVCPDGVRRSEFMILLLGDTYGELAPGHDVSHTHLEYLEAVAPGSDTWVLPAIISAVPLQDWSRQAWPDGVLRFREEVMQRHTTALFSKAEGVAPVAGRIVHSLFINLVEWMRHGTEADTDEPLEAEDRPTIDAALVDNLELRQLARLGRTEPQRLYEATRGPVSEAAAEHRRLADAALREGEPLVALQHMAQSLQCLPLQPKLQYEAAMLRLGSPCTRQQLDDTREQLLQAARWFERHQLVFWRSACYIGLARVELALDARRAEQAVVHCAMALEAPEGYDGTFNFRAARFEYARTLTLAGHTDDALKALNQLAGYSPRYLAQAVRDPSFVPLRDRLRQMLQGHKQEMLNLANEIVALGQHAEAIHHGLDALAPSLAQAHAVPALESGFDGYTATRMQQALRRYFGDFAGWLVVTGQALAEEAAIAGLPDCPFPGQAFEESFRAGDEAVLDRWLVRPGDRLSPGMPLMTYRYREGQQPREYRLNDRLPQGALLNRLLAPAGTRLARGTPLCDWVARSADVSVIEALRRRLAAARDRLPQLRPHADTGVLGGAAMAVLGMLACGLGAASQASAPVLLVSTTAALGGGGWAALAYYRLRREHAGTWAAIDADQSRLDALTQSLPALWRRWVGTLQQFEKLLGSVPQEAVPFVRHTQAAGRGQLALLRSSALPDEGRLLTGPLPGDGRLALYRVARGTDNAPMLQRAGLGAVPAL
ncbi:DUF4062 domain-containing protein [Pelomonas cellulosilytica]|uniref:DUF4062 domain-containing protein n=1 Tax=Pelomonas cellulosilytica TaxID=2906762 RepID=A0ABS8XYA8_9BURK|nr:DUF4062 domain-containing protein [Pelomonas sp. P8]MCE4555703.1 DUF4062 domain-containing protein [Pelomonas sp. P8]